MTARTCPTCAQRQPAPKPDGWGGLMDWSWVEPCLYCGAHVCGLPVSVGRNQTATCYTKHTAECHPERYVLPKDPAA